MALCREQALKLTISVFGTLTGPIVDLTYCLYGRRLACLCFSPVEYRPQWRSQDLEVGGTGGLGTEVPQQGPVAEPLVGGWGEAPRKLTAYYGYLAVKPCTILCIYQKYTSR